MLRDALVGGRTRVLWPVNAHGRQATLDERNGGWGIDDGAVAANGHALLLEFQELARALAAVGNFEEKSVETRGVVVTGDGVPVDVGEDESVFLVGVVIGRHGW